MADHIHEEVTGVIEGLTLEPQLHEIIESIIRSTTVHHLPFGQEHEAVKQFEYLIEGGGEGREGGRREEGGRDYCEYSVRELLPVNSTTTTTTTTTSTHRISRLMNRQHNRLPLSRQIVQYLYHRLSSEGIQTRGGLIQKEDGRVGDQLHTDGGTLTLTTWWRREEGGGVRG